MLCFIHGKEALIMDCDNRGRPWWDDWETLTNTTVKVSFKDNIFQTFFNIINNFQISNCCREKNELILVSKISPFTVRSYTAHFKLS